MTKKQKMDLDAVNQQLDQFDQVVNSEKAMRKVTPQEKLRAGVDLGTSSIVLTVLDSKDKPIYGAFEYDHAVRDGLVVNYMESVRILEKLKQKAEDVLGVPLTTACGAIPPKTGEGSAKIVKNVIEAAGFICPAIVDEPTAAAKFLQMQDGTVVDIGGGTTGISVFQRGKLVEVLDEATGGFHMTLVLAGNQHIKADKAELIKRDPANEDEVFGVIRPVVEKMATITKTAVKTGVKQPVIVVGGAINFKDFIPTFSKTLKLPAYKPDYPQFVTPLGIAMFDDGKAE
ncbi:ethanolamine utilization protein EutJ [Secundilactobacillus hailunensis]|uniref:Ethanolamine utilization protein EutJ n=1 Tax=Secundilactobacillus hailunensis TaxID=2559923 RepID=A0ABW1T9X8_9LACO|nr:ethanolamine utilization protein EutJ [Secundilactobacillus hailunensis]